jgi:hypothetical protein
VVDHLRPWDQPLREVLSGAATGKWLLGHEFPTFPRALGSADYWVESGWVYQEGVIGSEAGVNGYAKHDDYGGYVRGRKPNDADRTTGYRIRAKEAEIALAIEAGLDGFVHNLTDATPGSTFARRWLDLAEAAENMHAAGTLGDFRVALCPDGNTGGTPRIAPTDDPTDLEDLIVAHGARSSCLRLSGYSNKQLLFSFSPETAPNGTGAGGSAAATWWANRKSAVAARGEPVVFAAIFQQSWTSTAQAPSFASVADIMGRWGGSDWSSVSGANNDNANARAYAMSQFGKPWVHWSRWQDERPYSTRFYEPWGSSLLRNTWAVIEASNPFMVQSVTWDDYSECTQFYAGDPHHGFVPADVQDYHAIKWKLGAFPTIVRDGLFLFHRVQPRDIPTADYLSSQQTAFMPITAHTGGAAKDEVEVLAYLKAPATIYVISGAGPAVPFAGTTGENSFKVPLQNGTVQAWAVRAGVTVASITSPWNVSSTGNVVQDFKYRAVGSVTEEDAEEEPLATPDTIADLIGWWKADDLAGANGSTVNPWNSNGSYGPDLDETGGTAPTLDTSVAINGVNGVRFTASRTLRDTTSGTLSGFTNGIGGASMFVVAKLDDATGSTSRNAAVVSTATVGASRYALRCITGVPQWGARRADGVSSSLLNGSASIGTSAAHIMSGTIDYNSTTQKLYVDATEVGSSTSALTAGSTSTTSAGMAIGSHAGTATEGWPGVVYEVVLYSRALTTLERMTVQAYLADKYSITIADALILPLATFGTMSTSIPEPHIGLDVSITPAAISTSTTVASATKSAGATATPAVASTTTTAPSRTVSGAATALPSLASTTTTTPSRTVSGAATSTPGVVSVPTTTPAWTVSGGAASVPGVVSTSTSAPARSNATGGTVTPPLASTTTALGSSGVATSGNATIGASVLSCPVTIAAATVSAGSVFAPSIVSTTVSASTVTVAGHVFIAASSAVCAVSTPAPAPSVGVGGSPTALAVPVTIGAATLRTTADATPSALVTVIDVPPAEASAGTQFEVLTFDATSNVFTVGVSGAADAEPAEVLVPASVPAVEVTVPPPLIRALGREVAVRAARGREAT